MDSIASVVGLALFGTMPIKFADIVFGKVGVPYMQRFQYLNMI